MRIYLVRYIVYNLDTGICAESNCTVLAKNKDLAIRTTIAGRTFEDGPWEIMEIKARLSSSQKARIL